ncbi:sialate:O-sulfotransferase 2-like [Apostichopus japonicus]|uniref:sialate:O-sulfotransferase 2-like n=1 Tax=Stichopus japonicus TaxID=307972 RepID=UPI003AB59742
MGENSQSLLVLFLICLALACLDISFFYPKLTTPIKSSPKSAIISRSVQVRHLYSKPHRQALHKPYIDTVERRLIMLDKSANQNDSDCTHIRKVPKGSMKLRVLYSYEGSGSTWLRYLLELASGFHTGSHYRDNDDYMNGFIGEAMDPLDRTVLLVKNRGPNITRAFPDAAYEEAVILIRDPYEAILSSYFKQLYEDVGYIDYDLFRTREWMEFVDLESKKWVFGARYSCITVHPSITVYYEDLVSNTESELRRVLTFLNVNASSERMECSLSHSDRVFRKYEGRSEELNIDPYTDGMKKNINSKIRALRTALQHHNCGTVPQYEREK